MSGAPASARGRGGRRRAQMLTGAVPLSRVPQGVDPDSALPGEAAPLAWTAARGPVTDDEALGVLRRRRRLELAQQPKRSGAELRPVPDELPSEDARKVGVMFRLPPYYVALANARAELEETNLTAILEEALIKYARGRPSSPPSVRRRLQSLFDTVVQRGDLPG
jgi:hypothetical protein